MILIPRLGHGKIVKNTDPYFEMYAVAYLPSAENNTLLYFEKNNFTDWVMKKILAKLTIIWSFSLAFLPSCSRFSIGYACYSQNQNRWADSKK